MFLISPLSPLLLSGLLLLPSWRQVGVPNLDCGERAEGADERPRPPHPGDGASLGLDRVRVRAHQTLESEDAGGPFASATFFSDDDDDYCSRRRG